MPKSDNPMPDVIRVGYRDYLVEELPAGEADALSRYGDIELTEGIIRVRLLDDPVEEANTLLHEILHGIWRDKFMGKKEPEERAVHLLTNGIIGVLRDNPKFVKYLRRAIK